MGLSGIIGEAPGGRLCGDGIGSLPHSTEYTTQYMFIQYSVHNTALFALSTVCSWVLPVRLILTLHTIQNSYTNIDTETRTISTAESSSEGLMNEQLRMG